MLEPTNGEVRSGGGAIDAHEPCPPHRPAYLPPVTWARTGSAVRGIILAESILALWRHWAEGTSPLCTRKWGGCPYCERYCPSTWCVYLPIIRLPDAKRRVLVIPEAAYQCCELVQKHEGRLRGWGIVAQRMGERPNSPVNVTLSPTRNPPPLPQGFNPGPSLCKLWSIDPESPVGQGLILGGSRCLLRRPDTNGEG